MSPGVRKNNQIAHETQRSWILKYCNHAESHPAFCRRRTHTVLYDVAPRFVEFGGKAVTLCSTRAPPPCKGNIYSYMKA